MRDGKRDAAPNQPKQNVASVSLIPAFPRSQFPGSSSQIERPSSSVAILPFWPCSAACLTALMPIQSAHRASTPSSSVSSCLVQAPHLKPKCQGTAGSAQLIKPSLPPPPESQHNCPLDASQSTPTTRVRLHLFFHNENRPSDPLFLSPNSIQFNHTAGPGLDKNLFLPFAVFSSLRLYVTKPRKSEPPPSSPTRRRTPTRHSAPLPRGFQKKTMLISLLTSPPGYQKRRIHTCLRPLLCLPRQIRPAVSIRSTHRTSGGRLLVRFSMSGA
jgi:hypothetical protein